LASFAAKLVLGPKLAFAILELSSSYDTSRIGGFYYRTTVAPGLKYLASLPEDLAEAPGDGLVCESGRPSSLLLTFELADSPPEASAGFGFSDVGTSDSCEVCCFPRLEPEIAD